MVERSNRSKKAATRKAPAQKRSVAKKSASRSRSAASRSTGAKPVKKTAAKRAPTKKKSAAKSPQKPVEPPNDSSPSDVQPGSVELAVNGFLADAELTAEAMVKASLARRLAYQIDNLPVLLTPSLPGLSRELREALVGIMRRDDEQHDDWSTRLAGTGAPEDRDTERS